MYKDILILTKSRKRQAFCVAGIDIKTGEWVRIVTDDIVTEHAVLEMDMEYTNGEYADVLDVARIKFVKHIPSDIQPENWLLDRKEKWQKIETKTVNEVNNKYLDGAKKYIFYNIGSSVNYNEIINSNEICSLLLLEVSDVQFYVVTDNKKKVKVNFSYNGIRYKYIYLSDLGVEEEYLKKNDGYHNVTGKRLMVLSLTDKHTDGKYYKMVAKIF
jgi:hypothetical protein